MMRRLPLFSAPLFLLSTAVVAQAATGALPPGAPAAMSLIQAGELMAHATFLASDELGGRLTGSPGQEMAAKYIANQFASLGLEPLGDQEDDGNGGVRRSFFQSYGITRTFVDPATVLRLGALEAKDGFALLGAQPVEIEVQGKLLFLGLGRMRGSKADVTADQSFDGVVPVIVMRSPRGRIDRALSIEQKFGMAFAALGNLTRTLRGIAKKEPPMVLVAMTEDPFGLADVLNMMGLSPGKDLLAPRFGDTKDPMAMLGTMLGAGSTPVAVLGPDLAKQLLAELGVEQQALDAYLAPKGDDDEEQAALPKAKTDVAVELRLSVRRDEQATAKNVVAVLRGGEPARAGEAVVFSAHMDHIGRRMDGEVFNGADDNASGTSGLLGIAKAFAGATQKPARSVIFLSVSGEELGLWGSAYYADNPTWPRADIVADVNTDMIGRSGPESGPLEVTVTPSHRHDMFSTIVQDAARLAEQMNVTFTNGDKYYTRSDHFNFAKQGIPVVFFCNGEHEDYHQVSDHAEKLDADKMERIARLAFWTGWQVANAESRPRTLGSRQDWK